MCDPASNRTSNDNNYLYSSEDCFKNITGSYLFESNVLEPSYVNDLQDRPELKPVKSKSVISVFDYGSCGEPTRPQHLHIDFTPVGFDKDSTLQKKICNFFEYIATREDIQALIVDPDPSLEPDEAVSSEDKQKKSPTSSPDSSTSVSFLHKTAVSVLELVEKQELITRAFESNMPQSRCLSEAQSYESTSDLKDKIEDPSCKCKVCPRSAVQKLCRQMDGWDSQHQKSMDPPVGPPSEIYAKLQRIEPRDKFSGKIC